MIRQLNDYLVWCTHFNTINPYKYLKELTEIDADDCWFQILNDIILLLASMIASLNNNIMAEKDRRARFHVNLATSLCLIMAYYKISYSRPWSNLCFIIQVFGKLLIQQQGNF